MAHHTFCLVAFCWLVIQAATAWAAPTSSSSERVEPLRTPAMLKKIFADAETKTDQTATRDVLQLGISKQGAARAAKSSSPVMAVATSAAALIFVVGIFLLAAWLMKRGASRATRALPTDAFEVLGRSMIGQQQSVQLVRLGNKLLLVASSADGATTLAEIDDPVEVERLAALCMTGAETSATKEFHEAFEELAAGSTDSSQSKPGKQPSILDLPLPTRDSLSLSDASLLSPTS